MSITNPDDFITTMDDKEQWDRANSEASDLSAALAYRSLWPDNDEGVRSAFKTMRPTTPQELVEDLIIRTRR